MIRRAAKWSAVLAAAAIAGTAWGQSSTGTLVNPPAAPAYSSPGSTVVVPASGSSVVVVPDWSACNRLSGMARAQCLQDARGVSPMDSFGMQVASGKNAGYDGPSASDKGPGRSAASEGGSSGSGSSGGGR